mmetsp:Transcript_118931/g.253715  ORF Transcript_118931/g.253715 Transcript_118931/m.253715 type:complete len:326 (-) Transcript_118931:88-1065(-)
MSRAATPRKASQQPHQVPTANEFAEEALKRKGNAQARADLKDANRQYDPEKERKWEQKYMFFSNNKMKANFRTYARARHDPFNKDPSWRQAVIHNVAKGIADKKMTPEDVFNGIDVTGDGTLNRPELKKALISVLPTLSDMEIQAIFDVIDNDNSGEVALSEFCEAMDRGRRMPVPEDKSERHRNPIHRTKRFPPSTVEGWEHLEGPPTGGRADRVAEAQEKEVLGRLTSDLMSTPRALQHPEQTPKYHYFGGGADSARFHRIEWQKRGQTPGEPKAPGTPRFSFPDPGPDLRPGFLCDPRSRLAAQGFAALTPRTPASTHTKST